MNPLSTGTGPGIFSFLVGSMDNYLNKFVVSMSTNIAIAILPLFVTGMSIWVLTYGYAVMRNEVPDPVMTFVKMITKVSFIAAFAFSTAVYQSYIVDGVNAFVTGMVQVMIPNSPGGFFAALDAANEKAELHAAVIMGHGATLLPTGGYLDILAGVLELCANTVLLFLCGGYGLIARVALSLMLALGPLFIALLAFPATTKYFDAWASKVANYSILMLLLAAMVPFALAVSGAYIDKMQVNDGVVNAMSDAFGLVLINCGGQAESVMIWPE